MIYSLCYVSTKRKNLTPSEVRSIIDYANKKNSFDNITGILIEYKNNFIQYRPTANCQINEEIYIQSFDIDQNKTGDKTIRNSLD